MTTAPPKLPPGACNRCGHVGTYRRKPFSVWRNAHILSWPQHAIANLLVLLFTRKRPTCSWCHASCRPRQQARLRYEPFLNSVAHTLELMDLREDTAIGRLPDVKGRWSPNPDASHFKYLKWRDNGLCGLCGLSLDNGAIEVDHIIPKHHGAFSVRQNRLIPGLVYHSRLDHIDNLQLAHARCKKGKAATKPALRHPGLPPVPAAEPGTSPDQSSPWLWLP